MKQTINKIFSAAFFLGILSAVFLGFSVNDGSDNEIQAQSNRGLVVNEFFIDFEFVQPGETITDSFTITYDYDADEDGNYPSVTLFPRAADFTQGETPGVPKFLEPEEIPETARASSWITFAQESYTLTEPKQTAEVEFTLSVPENTEPGGKYVALLLSNRGGDSAVEDLQAEDSSGFGINSETGPLLFFTVAGEVEANLEVEAIYTENIYDDRTSFFFNPPVDIVVVFKNTGNVHAAPAGKVYVHRDPNHINDRDKLEYNINPENSFGFVLPGTSRAFSYRFGYEREGEEGEILERNSFITTRVDQENLVDGRNYYDEYDFSNISNLRIGRYFATAVYDYEQVDGNRVNSASVSTFFWVFPWQLLLIILFIFLLISIYIYRKLRKKEDKQGGNQKPN